MAQKVRQEEWGRRDEKYHATGEGARGNLLGIVRREEKNLTTDNTDNTDQRQINTKSDILISECKASFSQWFDLVLICL
jgi:hypothetical protein